MPSKKVVKHPSEMTNEEALRHLFHPKIVEHAKASLAEFAAPRVRKPKPMKKD